MNKKINLRELWERDPKQALAYVLHTRPKHGMWQSYMGIDGKTRYGSHQAISPKKLQGRTYLIEYLDGAISIHYLDRIFEPRGNLHLTLEEAASSIQFYKAIQCPSS